MMKLKKSKISLTNNVLQNLPFDLKMMIYGPNGFLQKCQYCNKYDIRKYAIFGNPCKNGCGIIVCVHCKGKYLGTFLP